MHSLTLPSHGLKDRLSQVISGHDNIPGIVRATPGKDRMKLLCGFPLLQRPVTQVNEKLHIRESHLDVQHSTVEGEIEFDHFKQLKGKRYLLKNIQKIISRNRLNTAANSCLQISKNVHS